MDIASAAERLQKFEGSIAYMYLDTTGNVTVGVGHMIPDAAHAATIVWMGDQAPAQVAADYACVAAAEKGKIAAHYQDLTKSRLSNDGVSGLLTADIQAFCASLAAKLPAWSTYPEPVQQALFDMAYNLGVGGLLKFHKMLASCAAANWALAATQCHREGIPDARNQETAALFQQAAS